MKFLIVFVVVFGACLANPQRRPQSYYDNNQDQQQNTAQNYQDNTAQQYQQNLVQEQQNVDNRRYQEPNEKVIKFIPIIRFDKEQGEDGSYKASYETGNNIIAEEEGYLKELGPDPEEAGKTIKSQVQLGRFTYTSPDGTVIETKYTADENGFHAEGDHLPTPPPVSPEVQKGLDLIFAGIRAQQEADARRLQEHPELKDRPQQYDDGQYRQELQ
ncbi:endocuticle structural glycoprotein SgAbd-1-like [Diorhabda carinulata]|uniref:endocuticle structural glycoprotein SgAbd-1-like n=1 Tax=Diorhabda sublineata TaxID=1163346 RepID=UPI0024E17E0A|nr:endocuticle structural glycoprotein SgAbd-1-like [Diorhabda sublineata]XP_057666727.1 endocuticle structural glycoprotein SgAbd-1-like [Diorhabda carinulata]